MLVLKKCLITAKTLFKKNFMMHFYKKTIVDTNQDIVSPKPLISMHTSTGLYKQYAVHAIFSLWQGMQWQVGCNVPVVNYKVDLTA